MSDAFITVPSATLTFVAGQKAVAVTGTLATSAGALAGDRAIDPVGLALAIEVVAATSLTLLRPAPNNGTVSFVIEKGPSRSLVALATQVTRDVFAKMSVMADEGRSIPVTAILNAPPSLPSDGDRWLIGTSPTGAWAGKANQFAEWSVTANGWVYETPVAGWSATINGQALRYIFTGSAWATPATAASDVVVTPTGGVAATNVQAAIAELDAEKLGATAQAADAALLGGQNGAFYRNASNLNAGTVPDARLPAYVPPTRSVNASTGLSGGGTLAADRTLAFDTTWGDARYPRLAMNNLFASAQRIRASYAALYFDTLDNASVMELVFQRNGVTTYTIAQTSAGGITFGGYSGGVYAGNDIAIAANGVITTRSGMNVNGNLNVITSGSVSGGSLSFGTSAAGVLAVPTDGSRLHFNPAGYGTVWMDGSYRLRSYGAGTLVTDASGNVTASSDERLKENIQPYTVGREALRKIGPISYSWNRKSGFDRLNRYHGVSAQNLKEAHSSFVCMGADGYLNPNYPAISAAQTNTINELDAAITEQERVIADLVAQVEALSTRLAALENA